jgi:hypothetical protein
LFFCADNARMLNDLWTRQIETDSAQLGRRLSRYRPQDALQGF